MIFDPYTLTTLSGCIFVTSLLIAAMLWATKKPVPKKYSLSAIIFFCLSPFLFISANIEENMQEFLYRSAAFYRFEDFKIRFNNDAPLINGINSRNMHGSSLVMLAAQYGNAEVLRYLLDKGARMDFADDDGDTALMMADRYGKTECARLLRQAGATH
jgi:Ankyrin repeats (3 copies)